MVLQHCSCMRISRLDETPSARSTHTRFLFNYYDYWQLAILKWSHYYSNPEHPTQTQADLAKHCNVAQAICCNSAYAIMQSSMHDILFTTKYNVAEFIADRIGLIFSIYKLCTAWALCWTYTHRRRSHVSADIGDRGLPSRSVNNSTPITNVPTSPPSSPRALLDSCGTPKGHYSAYGLCTSK